MRYLLLGDSHGDINFLKWAGEKAVSLECDAILQLGDFGWWPDKVMRTKYSIQKWNDFLDELSKLPVPIYWIDGNHEDHDDVDTWEYKGDFIECAPNIFYIPRGHSWEIDGVKFMGVGGAYSIDRDDRVLGVSWFHQEMINEAEVERASSVGKVDVLFSHDTPSCTDMVLEFAKNWMVYSPIGETEVNRYALQRIVDATQPSHIYHGHWHMDFVQHIGGMRIEGLHCNYMPSKAYTVFDTGEFK